MTLATARGVGLRRPAVLAGRPGRGIAVVVAALLGAAPLATACRGGQIQPARATTAGPAVVAPPPAAPAPAAPAGTPAETTDTMVDPGTLPQTTRRPSSTDPTFLARMQVLLQAAVAGTPATALPAFFPASAYRQVKAIHDPLADWQHRLMAAYDRDLLAWHGELAGAPATLVGVDVPATAPVWVRPGQEYNKLGYWRVYGTRLRYARGGRLASFPIASLISWRGQWYVVHLSHIA